ncbi:hypothetical protein L9F63_023919 [Diploptera punctata]|uniref:Cytochrome b5 heme-binding domain-containing protein n=1 Tax=Diploptera punctata TaxID=6984 RepID=A0AAD8E8S3_DIPPU|nr:hypothetical protein L9F63_023919 [Diploptera punctata]
MAEVKLYSLEEVKAHKSKESAWCIYENSVYDVTDYLDLHPGGGDLVLDECGGDMTKEFDDIGHSDSAREDLKKYKIGELRPEDRNNNEKDKSKKPCCVIM